MRLWQAISITVFIVLSVLSPVRAQAETANRYASIVVDADTLEIIHARQIDKARFPASLTKVMTLYLTFDALNNGTLTLDQPLKISKNAATTPPVRIGLRAGRTLSVSDAIQALTVRSANDAAVVLAEAIGGTEENFARLMTERAHSLGMISTEFRNANGLPNPEQKTNARDMAKLAAATLNNHRRYYHYFGQKYFRYKGRTYKNTNALLYDSRAEVDGFKTGYTDASGYNLIISAQRDGRRLIAVVLGGASGNSRNQHMRDLIRRGFKSMGLSEPKRIAPVTLASATQTDKDAPTQLKAKQAFKTASNTRTVLASQKEKAKPKAVKPAKRVKKTSIPSLKSKSQIKTKNTLSLKAAQPPKTIRPLQAIRLRGRNKNTINVAASPIDVKLPRPSSAQEWSVQIGIFPSQKQALNQLTALMGFSGHNLTPESGVIMPLQQGESRLYRARFRDLSYEEARKACESMKNLAMGCFIVASAR